MQSLNTAKLEHIASKLALPPFSQKHTLISLTELLANPSDALRLLKDVAERIRPTALSDEYAPPKATSDAECAYYISEYASCVLFGENQTIDCTGFANYLYYVNSSQLVDLLDAILEDLPAAKEKAYIAKFKGNFRIPPEILQEPALYQSLYQLRYAYQRFYEAYDANQAALQRYVSLRIEQMTTEKQQLVAREDKLSALVRQLRLRQVPDEAVQLARRRREGVAAIQQLQEQISSQNDQRKAVLQRAYAVVSAAKGTPADIIEACQAENYRLRYEVRALPLEITEKQQLRDLITQDPTDEQIAYMEQEMEQAKRDLARLRELYRGDAESGAGGAAYEGQVAYLRQQVAKFKRKHVDLQERVEKVVYELQKIDTKMRYIMNNNMNVELIDEVEEIPLVVFKDVISRGKAIKPYLARFYADRNYLKREAAVLQRTVEILTQICYRYGANVEDATEQQMMSTYNAHEARYLLQEVEAEIREKRSRMHPMQNELVEQRRVRAQLEGELYQTRQHIQQISASQYGGVYRLKMTLQKAENECYTVMSAIMRAEKQIKLYKLEIERAESEKSFVGLKKEIMIAQNGVKTKVTELRQKQQQVKEGLGEQIYQKKMFTDLLTLLRAKKQHTQSLSGKMGEDGEQVVKIV